MPVSMAVALAGLAITVIVGFTKTISAIAQLQFKVDMMWEDFHHGKGAVRFGHCRWNDPPAEADDHNRDHPEDE